MRQKSVMAEQRRMSRKACFVPVEGRPGTPLDQIRTVDISRGGMGLICRHEVSLNEKIAVELQLSPEAEPVLAMGQVQWVRRVKNNSHYRVGMKFTDFLFEGAGSRMDEYLPG